MPKTWILKVRADLNTSRGRRNQHTLPHIHQPLLAHTRYATHGIVSTTGIPRTDTAFSRVNRAGMHASCRFVRLHTATCALLFWNLGSSCLANQQQQNGTSTFDSCLFHCVHSSVGFLRDGMNGYQISNLIGSTMEAWKKAMSNAARVTRK